MEIGQKLNSLLEKNKLFISEYEELIKEIGQSDILSENIELKKEIANNKKVIEEITYKLKELTTQKENLQIALKQQILDEKLNILKVSREKLEIYFNTACEEYGNGLLELECETKKKIENLRTAALREMIDTNDDFYKEVDKLSQELQVKINNSKDDFSLQKAKINGDINNSIDVLSNQEINQDMIEKLTKKNDFEIKIGLNLINKIGIFLILLGISYALRYSYSNWFTPHVKGIFSFLIGAIFLGAGEWFYKKGKDIFAKGVIGGGIGILYYSVFNSMFILDLISITTAMLLCLLIATTTLVLSLRYDSETIGGFALIGGFLPFFTYVFNYGLSSDSLVLAMGYLFVLNLTLLVISIYKKWNVIKYISFILNVPTLIYLVFEVTNTYVGVLYSILTFGMYLAVTLIYPLKNKVALRTSGVILLGLNTFISCIIIYSLFEKTKLEDYRGILAMGFCLIYYGLGSLISKVLDEEKTTQGLFYLTSLTFAVLVVPFQFGVNWIVLGWLIEGTLLTIYGNKNKNLFIEIPGWIIVGICTAAFYFICLFDINIQYFDVNYIAFVVGLITILFIYLNNFKYNVINKYSERGTLINIFKYFTIINFWIYLVYMSNRVYNLYIQNNYYDSYYKTVIFALMTVLVASLCTNISLLKDNFIKYFAFILYGLVDLICIIVNSFSQVWVETQSLRYLAIGILMVYNIFVFFNIRHIILNFVNDFKSSLEIYPLIMAIYFLGTTTVMLIVQFNLGHINLLFSLLYCVLSFIYIMYGFKRNYINVRWFGLGLLVFATAKLFMYDLRFLGIGGKILAYLGFGFVMLAISFVYQKLKSSYEQIKHTA